MNMWTIISVVTVVLVIAGIGLTTAGITSNDETDTNTELTSCGQSCQNACSSTSNCGQTSCGATAGKKCGCS